MKLSRRKCLSEAAGYSLVEMMMTLAIGLILVSVALPTMIGAIQSYRLNSVSQQVASLIELTRYTAIRRNSVVRSRTTPDNAIFFIDVNGNGTLDAGEPMVMLPSDMQLANSQCPKPDPNTPGLDPRLASLQDFAGQITFDYRGTVNFSGGGSTAPYFLALGYVSQAQYGCRAITVTSMGQTKLWKAPDKASWTGM
jgi:prepilin-type N-terminal cleavage/methylation domain-containing protein